jgi:hypothetical protein
MAGSGLLKPFGGYVRDSWAIERKRKTSLREIGEKAGSHVRNREEKKCDEKERKDGRSGRGSRPTLSSRGKTNTKSQTPDRWRFVSFNSSNSVCLGFPF